MLRRWPDLEAPELYASDAADRLILDESRAARAAAPDGIALIGDAYGALALSAVAEGASDPRSHQDARVGELALAANAARLGLAAPRSVAVLDADAVRGARVVLLRLPRSLDALRDIAALIAAHADPDVVVFAGGRVKHMSVAMNDVLAASFERVDVTHARQKSRVLVASRARVGVDVDGAPLLHRAVEDGLQIRAYGGAFAGARLDIGTRMLLRHLPAAPGGGTADDPLIDFACGTGVVAAHLALRHPEATVLASDQSAVAVRSALATAQANGVADRVRVVRDDLLRSRDEASASFIALNPPFHSAAAVTDKLAPRLFADAARVLRPGGELWCVWNSSLRYRPQLERLVGETRQIARDAKFTVTVSTRR